MKITIHKRTRLLVGAGCIMIVLILGLLLLKEARLTETVQEEQMKYAYQYGQEVKYAVNLKPNILYEEAKLTEGQNYITEFVDSINVNFKSLFEGQGNAKLAGQYEVIAKLVGYHTKDEQKQEIWSKTYQLVPMQKLEGNETFVAEKFVKVDYPKYNQFAQRVIEETKINSSVELRVIMQGEMVVETDYGSIQKPLLMQVSMPLDQNYFMISKTGEAMLQDGIKEVREVEVPVDSRQAGIYISGIVVSVLVFVGVMFGSVEPTLQQIKEQQMKRLFNHYGSRMVAVEGIKLSGDEEIYVVHEIEDLIKIADELEKPIMYQYTKELREIDRLYIMAEKIIYQYEIETI